MRSFKFRIWDNIDKHMYYMPAAELYEQFFLRADGVLCDVDQGNFEHQPLGDRYEISFFTGLLDCEGREIWEGDIVEFYVKLSNFESRLTVELHRGTFCIRGNRGIFYFCNLDGVEKCFQVIGNRFANPELFEVLE